MLNLIISGCNGYMGRAVSEIVKNDPEVSIAAGFDIISESPVSFPVYNDPEMFTGAAGAIIDFSSPSALDALLKYGISKKTPLVLCTTGYSAAQLQAIEDAAARIPMFRSGNMSLGINLLIELVKRACTVLGETFDIEIVEHHHRRKVDAPSGTALMLADAAASALAYAPEYIYERRSRTAPRSSREIGISSVRGGTVVGRHEVIFAGPHEVIELSHNADSREVFAAGAVKAAKFISGLSEPGLYDMGQLIAYDMNLKNVE